MVQQNPAINYTDVFCMRNFENSQENMTTNKLTKLHPIYRADIDGLRAIAVLSVVGFHAFPYLITSGFTGVDIFFVISGYLISTIIFTNLEHDTFSIKDFYDRRIRRIFPALITVMITCLAFGWIFLLAGEYSQLGKHIAGGTTFIANILLYSETGYFDNSAETKPMLHLWSLAIEEQFYIFWPIMLAYVWKKKQSFLTISMVIAIISFSANIILSNRNLSAAFYWPISRFWELMIGGILAYISIHRPEIHRRFKNTQSSTGLILIAASIFLIDKNIAFPSWPALLPSVGAFLIISAGPNAWLNKNILSNKILVWIGLISYPLYLWHWPLLAFARIQTGEPSRLTRFALVLLAIILSSVTYYFIEKRIRRAPQKSTVILLAGSLATICAISVGIFLNDGIPDRASAQYLAYGESHNTLESYRKSNESCKKLLGLELLPEEVCIANSKAPKILFAGDSHAMALHSAIVSKDIIAETILVAGHGCQIFPNLEYTPTYEFDYGNNCTSIAKKILSVAQSTPSVKTVVLSNFSYNVNHHESKYGLNGTPISKHDAFITETRYVINRLLDLGKTVVLVIDVPHLKYHPMHCLQRISFIQPTECRQTPEEHKTQTKEYRVLIDELRADFPALLVFDPTDMFCNNGFCENKDGSKFLYNDISHINIHASKMVLDRMRSDGFIDY